MHYRSIANEIVLALFIFVIDRKSDHSVLTW